MKEDPYQFLTEKLEQQKRLDAYRSLKTDNTLIDFCSNDYLGFSKLESIHNHPYNLDRYGSTGSRLLSGNHQLTEDTERFIADFHRYESALIFNSGYLANLGLLSTVPKKDDIVVYDKLIHASIRDGIRLGNAEGISFEHNNIDDLEKKLKKQNKRIFVVVESLYSMDGDLVPLEEINQLCKDYKAHLIVDEAHATGVIGKKGKGLVNELKLENKVFAQVVTFGKSLGCHGAAILGNQLLRDFLINFCRPFIYTTAAPISEIAKLKRAYLEMEKGVEQKQLEQNVELFRSLITALPDHLFLKSNSPIQALLAGSNSRAKEVASSLQQKGYDVRAILAPTVPKGTERIRICIHSFNTKEEIEGLIGEIKHLV